MNKYKGSNITPSPSIKADIINDGSLIFNFLDPQQNDILSKMSKSDLQNFIILLNKYYLQYRKFLGFDKGISFGFELEFEYALKETIEEKIKNCIELKDWIIKNDNSLEKGAEINSPILHDSLENWSALKNTCDIAKSYASIGNKSGGHIHIGAEVLNNKYKTWLNFIKLWSVYENIIFRFSYGTFLNARPSISKYAKPVAKEFWDIYKKEIKTKNNDTYELIRQINNEKYQAVNFSNVATYYTYKALNTIEFRCPNGTLEPVIWQNNIYFFIKILEYAKSENYNDDIVQKRYQKNSKNLSSLSSYSEICLQQALELSDMIFTNNFDKIYFLRQYLKSFQMATNEYEEAKQFIKI